MIKFDSKTKLMELELPDGEAQYMKEVSSIIAGLRDYFYSTGKSEDEVNNLCFAVFKIAMENTEAFPYSDSAFKGMIRRYVEGEE